MLVAQVGLTCPGALHCLARRVIGSRCRIEGLLLRLLLRWSIWTVVSGSDGLTELLLSIRLAVLLRRSELPRLAVLFRLAVLSELLGATWLAVLSLMPWLARYAELILSAVRSGAARLSWLSRMSWGTRLTLRSNRTVGLTTIGLTTIGLTTVRLAAIGRTESNRAIVGTRHVRHWSWVLCAFGNRACLRMRGNVIANCEFFAEEGKHREYTGEEGNQGGEEREVRSDVPELDRGQQVDEREGERSTGENRDRLIKAE